MVGKTYAEQIRNDEPELYHCIQFISFCYCKYFMQYLNRKCFEDVEISSNKTTVNSSETQTKYCYVNKETLPVLSLQF